VNSSKAEIIIIDQPNESKDYVLKILQYARQKNPYSFLFFKHEYTRRKNQIDSHLQSYFDSQAKIVGARKCRVKEISKKECRNFCNEFHIQGSNSLAIIAFGLFYENELVGVLSLGRHHRNNEDVLLDRMCFKTGYRVQGGASKLFNAAIVWSQVRGLEKIISFSDNRYSLGNVYEKLGFKLDKELPPDYFYLDRNDPDQYHSKQSQKKSNVACPDDMTERQWAEKRGLIQIFDAGKKKWVYKLRRISIKSFKSRRRGYYKTKKGRPEIIFWQSSYELRAAILLDERNDVDYFTNQVKFSGAKKQRFIDFIVTLNDGSRIVLEVKPENQIEKCKEQIQDNKNYAAKNGFQFQIWSLKELGFKSDHEQVFWADQFISQLQNIDYVAERKKRHIDSVKKNYRNKIAKDIVHVYCEYCKEVHTPLRLTHDRNLERNSRYICEREGGHIAGSRPKDHLKKENPYASDSKKQCNECKQIKLFEDFSPDKSKRDGYSTRCKICRAAKYKQAYKNKKAT
jgi:predicted GNAT family N-acyltransferase